MSYKSDVNKLYDILETNDRAAWYRNRYTVFVKFLKLEQASDGSYCGVGYDLDKKEEFTFSVAKLFEQKYLHYVNCKDNFCVTRVTYYNIKRNKEGYVLIDFPELV